MKTTLRVLPLGFMLASLAGGEALACRFTPVEWQQAVKEHPMKSLIGQRKHTTWIRDRNRDFIDDEIQQRFKPGERVNIVVDLNRCIPVERIPALLPRERYGRVTYIGRLVTFVLLSGARVEVLHELAALPEVAMVEWQTPLMAMNDVSTRAVQSRRSVTYPAAAESLGFTGKNVNIAFLDTGVDDDHAAFQSGKFQAGFDALQYEDTNGNGKDDTCDNGTCSGSTYEPGTGTTNPGTSDGHGTAVASTALGAHAAGAVCRTAAPPDDASTNSCAGVAPDANLVDVRVCCPMGTEFAELVEGLDWIGINAKGLKVRVANISIGSCADDDGQSAIAEQVNYVVSLGVSVVVAHGNAGKCGKAPGFPLTGAPGSSSLAITVAGSKDQSVDTPEIDLPTVTRDDDLEYTWHLSGPRNDFPQKPELAALKPDVAAPAEDIYSALRATPNDYETNSGTSMAAPHVAGAAAAVIEARPSIDPGSLKDLLKWAADPQHNVAPTCGVGVPCPSDFDPVWDPQLGSGLLRVYDALADSTADVKFPTCIGPPAAAGLPCVLTPPLDFWNNTADLSTTLPPKVGDLTTIKARIKNSGPSRATVNVNFGVYLLAMGNRLFHHIGTKRVTIDPNDTIVVSQDWTPTDGSHQCLQVSIDFGLDSDFTNNVTQRNLEVGASVYEVQVENPLLSPARILLQAKSDRAGWECRLSDTAFTIDPFQDCPRKVRVEFDAPPGTPFGESANCRISATATDTARSRQKPVPIGGVTVQTFVPKPCRIVGMIVDERGRPVPGATLEIRRAPRDRAWGNGSQRPSDTVTDDRSSGGTVRLLTDEDGIFEGTLTPQVRHLIRIGKDKDAHGEIVARLQCGAGRTRFMLSRAGVTEVD